MIKFFVIFCCLIVCGCVSNNNIVHNRQHSATHQLTAPPSLHDAVYEIQINSAPMPFFLAHPYVVWVNGERIYLSRMQTFELARHLGLPLDPPQDTLELHRGDGWDTPLSIGSAIAQY